MFCVAVVGCVGVVLETVSMLGVERALPSIPWHPGTVDSDCDADIVNILFRT